MTMTTGAEQESLADQAKEQAGEVAGYTKDTVGEAVGDLTTDAKAAAREVVEEATGAVKYLLAEARDLARRETVGRVETMVRSAADTADDTREGLLGTIRHNPVPAALVGLGLGWLWLNRRNAQTHRASYFNDREHRAWDDRDYGYRGERGAYYPTGYGRGEYAGGPSQQGGNVVAQAAGRVGEAAGTVAGTAGTVAGAVGETAGNVVGAVGQTVGSVASTVGETASTLVSGTRETAGNLVGGVQHRAGRVEDSVGRALRENPLAVGAVALALGTAVGLALPQTQREHQLLGEARDTLVERAQELAQETFEKARSVAGEAQQAAGQAVQQEAKAQGLTQ